MMNWKKVALAIGAIVVLIVFWYLGLLKMF